MKIFAIDIGEISVKYTIFETINIFFDLKHIVKMRWWISLSNREDALKTINEIILWYKSTIVTLAIGTGICGVVIVEGNKVFGTKCFVGELGMMSVFIHENKDIYKPTFGSQFLVFTI